MSVNFEAKSVNFLADQDSLNVVFATTFTTIPVVNITNFVNDNIYIDSISTQGFTIYRSGNENQNLKINYVAIESI